MSSQDPSNQDDLLAGNLDDSSSGATAPTDEIRELADFEVSAIQAGGQANNPPPTTTSTDTTL